MDQGEAAIIPHISCRTPLQVYDMKRPLDLPLEDYERSREMLDAEEEVDVDRNAWKRDAWQAGEEFGWDNWGAASQTYFRHVHSDDSHSNHLPNARMVLQRY